MGCEATTPDFIFSCLIIYLCIRATWPAWWLQMFGSGSYFVFLFFQPTALPSFDKWHGNVASTPKAIGCTKCMPSLVTCSLSSSTDRSTRRCGCGEHLVAFPICPSLSQDKAHAKTFVSPFFFLVHLGERSPESGHVLHMSGSTTTATTATINKKESLML